MGIFKLDMPLDSDLRPAEPEGDVDVRSTEPSQGVMEPPRMESPSPPMTSGPPPPPPPPPLAQPIGGPAGMAVFMQGGAGLGSGALQAFQASAPVGAGGQVRPGLKKYRF